MIDGQMKLVYSSPAFTSVRTAWGPCFCSSVVERILGKDEVAGSSPARSFWLMQE